LDSIEPEESPDIPAEPFTEEESERFISIVGRAERKVGSDNVWVHPNGIVDWLAS